MSKVPIAPDIEKREDRKAGTRDRIVREAATLLAEGGRDAVSTRAVAEAAGVQPPTIYRLFGDMRGLLDEVVAFGYSAYLKEKLAREGSGDPVEDLRRGWDLHVGFGLANPAFYKLMYGDPRPGTEPTAALTSFENLHGVVERIAEAGRLRVSVERAAAMIHAAAMGVVLSLLAAKLEDRDPGLSEVTREVVLGAVTTDGTAENSEAASGRTERDRLANHSVALRTILPETEERLSPGERILLSELLDRLSDS